MDPKPVEHSKPALGAFSASLSIFRAIADVFRKPDRDTPWLKDARSKISDEHWSKLRTLAPGTEMRVNIGENSSFSLSIKGITENRIPEAMMADALKRVGHLTRSLGNDLSFTDQNLAEIAQITEKAANSIRIDFSLSPDSISGRFNGANISLGRRKEGQSSAVWYSGSYSIDGSSSERFTPEQAEILYTRIISIMQIQRYEQIPTHLEYLILRALRNFCSAEFGPPRPPAARDLFRF